MGASPTRQPLQPEATAAVMEVTKWLKPPLYVNSLTLARRSKTRLVHLTMEQLPPSPFTREQSAAASSLDRPTT